MEQKPHKKEELTLANNVLKLAEALLKVRDDVMRHDCVGACCLLSDHRRYDVTA